MSHYVYRNGVAEHRRVWEEANGSIPRGFVIHHVNEVKDDNRPENLIALSQEDHTRLHHAVPPLNRQAQEEELLKLDLRVPKLLGICGACGIPYVASRKSQRFCSVRCGWRSAWHRKPKRLPCECRECQIHYGENCGRRGNGFPVRCDDCRRREATRRSSATRKHVVMCSCLGTPECPDHWGQCRRPVARQGRTCPQCSSSRSQQEIELREDQQQCRRCTILIPRDAEELCDECVRELTPR